MYIYDFTIKFPENVTFIHTYFISGYAGHNGSVLCRVLMVLDRSWTTVVTETCAKAASRAFPASTDSNYLYSW